MRIPGSVFLITGASSGIGAELARQLLAQGAKVALLARREAKLREIAGENPNALVIPGDLLDPECRSAAVERTIACFGRLDVLVNNAGIGQYAPSWSSPVNDLRHIFELNLMAAVELTQHAVAQMLRQHGGMIINVSSIAGQVALPWFTLYSSSKHALMGFSDGLRIELAPVGIHVMSVCPGYVSTDFQQNVLGGKPPEAIRRAKSFAVTTEQCVAAILSGIERNQRTVVTPWYGWFFVWARRIAPYWIDGILAKYNQQLPPRS